MYFHFYLHFPGIFKAFKFEFYEDKRIIFQNIFFIKWKKQSSVEIAKPSQSHSYKCGRFEEGEDSGGPDPRVIPEETHHHLVTFEGEYKVVMRQEV